MTAANDAYCDATSNEQAGECRSEQLPTADGDKIGSNNMSISGIGNITYRMSCELWKFPDGNNGYYYLDRNCTVTRIEP